MVSIFLIGFTIQKIKNNEKLIFKSIEAKKLRGFSEINVLLYNYLENSPPDQDVITISDNVFTYLPYIGERFVRISCGNFINLIEANYKDKNYYLLIKKDNCDFNSLYQEILQYYEVDKLFEYKNHQFYLIKN